MSLKHKIHTLFHTPRFISKQLCGTRLFKLFPDKIALKIMYKNCFLEKLDLKNPTTFNAKLQWLKLYNRKPEYTTMVDKYKVRDYVKEKIGEEYLIPLLGVWRRAKDIDFDTLPNQFVLKCNHGSSCNIICKDKSKLDIKATIKKLNKWMKTDYYKLSREWPYKNVERRIIAEKFMEDDSNDLKDYKFLCFNGEPKLIELHSKRFTNQHTQDFYDCSWNLTDFEQVGDLRLQHKAEKPNCLEKMLNLTKILCKDLIHVRVDWYVVNDNIYFGELTFFDGGGFCQFINKQQDEEIGSWLQLENIKNGDCI